MKINNSKTFMRILERISFAASNASIPFGVIIFLDSNAASQYFLATVIVQFCFQINYIFGIEYRLQYLIDERSIGVDTLIRLFLPIATLFVYVIVIRHGSSFLLIIKIFIYSLIVDICGNAKLVSTRSNVPVSIVLSNLFVAITALITIWYFVDIDVALLIISTVLILTTLYVARVKVVVFWPSMSEIKTFFMDKSYTSILVWFISRGDRLILPAIGFELNKIYVILAAINDFIFVSLRQTVLMQRSYAVTMAVCGVFVSICIGILYCVHNNYPISYINLLAIIPGFLAYLILAHTYKLIRAI